MLRSLETDGHGGNKEKALMSARRDEIVRVALEHFVRKGYDDTTMEEIAEAAGMSKGNLYNYITSKEDLVYLIREWTVINYREELEMMEAKLAALGPVEALKYYISAYIRNVDSVQDAYNFLNHVVIKLDREGRRKLFEGSLRVQESFERLLQAGVSSGAFKPMNAKLIAHNIAMLGTAWAHNRWNLRKFVTIEDFIAQQSQFILDSITAGNLFDAIPEHSAEIR